MNVIWTSTPDQGRTYLEVSALWAHDETLVRALMPLCAWGNEHRVQVDEIMLARSSEQEKRAGWVQLLVEQQSRNTGILRLNDSSGLGASLIEFGPW